MLHRVVGSAVKAFETLHIPYAVDGSVASGRSFNVIHMPSAFKVDVFPATEDFHHAQLERATCTTFDFLAEQITCRVVTPEDVLLAKLRWFRTSGETSERQWNDLAGVMTRAAIYL